MIGADTLEKEVAEEDCTNGHWKNFPDHLPVAKPEMSKVYGWPDIPKNGGGDVDLANYKND